jgi:L-rhamnose mutarotase
MAREVFLLDLSDVALAQEYEAWHKPGKVPPQVLADIRAAGVTIMDIYRSGDRLVMITETLDDKASGDRIASLASRNWEALMDRYQRPLAWADAGTKWQTAERIFDIQQHNGI